jgi:hypothetical protein
VQFNLLKKGDLRLMAKEKNKDRKILKSVGFTETELDCYDDLFEREPKSLSEHVRIAFDEYLRKKGYDI